VGVGVLVGLDEGLGVGVGVLVGTGAHGNVVSHSVHDVNVNVLALTKLCTV
jgi:hypothetical protein